MPRFAIDKLTVLDGVIIARGWCEGQTPSIIINGQTMANQASLRYRRPDVEAHLQAGAESPHGFTISAIPTIYGYNNAEIALQFADGTVTRPTASSQEPTVSDLFGKFLNLTERAPNTASLIELGSRARSGNTYRELFSSVQYTGVDITPGDNVDIVGDLHQLSKSVDQEFDFAFSVSVWEHLLMPWVVSIELNKTLKVGGLVFIQSHPSWPLHDEPWDFFRFSKESWRGLFNGFTGFELVDTAYELPANVVPIHADGGALQGIDAEPTFLASACIARKISAPSVDWSCDPSEIFDLVYDHSTGADQFTRMT
jgi:hypothetical protein